MSKRQLIILFGALIILVALFSAVPATWNKIIDIILGVLIIAVAYTTTKSPRVVAPTEHTPVIPYVDAHDVDVHDMPPTHPESDVDGNIESEAIADASQ